MYEMEMVCMFIELIGHHITQKRVKRKNQSGDIGRARRCVNKKNSASRKGNVEQFVVKWKDGVDMFYIDNRRVKKSPAVQFL